MSPSADRGRETRQAYDLVAIEVAVERAAPCPEVWVVAVRALVRVRELERLPRAREQRLGVLRVVVAEHHGRRRQCRRRFPRDVRARPPRADVVHRALRVHVLRPLPAVVILPRIAHLHCHCPVRGTLSPKFPRHERARRCRQCNAARLPAGR